MALSRLSWGTSRCSKAVAGFTLIPKCYWTSQSWCLMTECNECDWEPSCWKSGKRCSEGCDSAACFSTKAGFSMCHSATQILLTMHTQAKNKCSQPDLALVQLICDSSVSEHHSTNTLRSRHKWLCFAHALCSAVNRNTISVLIHSKVKCSAVA